MTTVTGVFVAQFDKDSATLEDLLLREGDLMTLIQRYEAHSIEIHEKISDQLNEVGAEITLRNQANLRRQLKELKSRRAALSTEAEKRANTDAAIAKLEAQLGTPAAK